MGTRVEFPVFNDGKGNLFVFPGFYTEPDNPDRLSATTIWSKARHIEMALGVTEEKDRLCLETDDDGGMTFPHVIAEAMSRGFAHGGDTVWLISGPTFDECAAETANGG